MDTITLARAQMGISLAFHILFSALGVGLPLLLVLADLRAAQTGDARYTLLARRMAKGTAILFAVGAVSGTVLSLELGLLWPELMRRFGEVIGPLFALEGFAFFTEAIFLGIYLYGRDRVSRRIHMFSGWVVAVSGAASAGFVTVVNAFMNGPVPVRWDGDRAFLDSPMAVFGAPSAPTQVLHVLLSSYAVTAFAMCGVHAFLWLRGKERDFHRAALGLALPLACVTGLLMPLSGDLSAKHVTKHQVWKVGAMEAHYETGPCAPLRIGGLPDDEARRVRYDIEIPCGLSVLGAASPSAVIQGLDQVPRDEWPPVLKTHVAFQVMVGAGSAMALLSALTLAFRAYRKRWPEHPMFLRALVACAVLAPTAMEAGWLVTEWGRQPFVVRGLLTTAEAATHAAGLGPRLFVFLAIYLFLGITVITLLTDLFRGEPEVKEATEGEGAHGA
ncbi:MAG: cytochrome ubiquinol oxidase subunit I [Deltaproteobacteria bacterium]|nr:cytochrome ubiquinol oxidase subunit I [Deltaproteobacteria bacterium]